MRFDKTFIAIRERGTLEIFDLALHVVVDHFKPLFWLLIIGSVPWIVLDLWLLGWMLDTDDFGNLYYWTMFLLIVSQAQVGTMFMTRYLGQAMFVGRPGIWATVKDVFSTSPYFIWSHAFLRLVLPTILACFLISKTEWGTAMTVCCMLMPAIVGIGILVRALRPFASEILQLERTPISSADENQVNFARRSKALHTSASSELFGRCMISAMFAVPLGFACFSMFISIDSIFNLRFDEEYTYSPYYWVAAGWLVAGFVCVARFLSYIDMRIRQEGWAVELRMRAEGQQLLNAVD